MMLWSRWTSFFLLLALVYIYLQSPWSDFWKAQAPIDSCSEKLNCPSNANELVEVENIARKSVESHAHEGITLGEAVWAEIWKRSNGAPRFHQLNVNPYILEHIGKFRDSIILTPGKKPTALVPLCGKSKDLTFLAGWKSKYTEPHLSLDTIKFDVTGVEFVQQAVDELSKEEGFTWREKARNGDFDEYIAENDGKEIGLCLLKGDFFKLNANNFRKVAIENARDKTRPIDFCFDRASLVAIQPHEREKYAEIISGLCKNVFLLTVEYDQTKRTGPPFSISEDIVRNLYQETYDIELLQKVVGPPCADECVYKLTLKPMK